MEHLHFTHVQIRAQAHACMHARTHNLACTTDKRVADQKWPLSLN